MAAFAVLVGVALAAAGRGGGAAAAAHGGSVSRVDCGKGITPGRAEARALAVASDHSAIRGAVIALGESDRARRRRVGRSDDCDVANAIARRDAAAE